MPLPFNSKISFMENELHDNTVLNADRPLTKRERRELAKEQKRTEQTKNERTKEIKKWIVRVLVLIAIGFGGYKLWQWINTPQDGRGTGDILTVKEDDWVKGNRDAKITLIEYADFECPACKIYSTEVMNKLTDEYKGDLRIVFRHFPLPQHKKAVDAAKAAEAAGRQGKFWEMHDLLYEKQEEWSGDGNYKDKFKEYANSLSLDMSKFENDLGSDETSRSIKNDETDGYTLHINETPTFFVNGKKADVKNGYPDLKKAIDNALGL